MRWYVQADLAALEIDSFLREVHLSVFLCHNPGCYKITTVFSHAQSVVLCVSCSTILCQPTGGRAKLTEGKPCAHWGTLPMSSSGESFSFVLCQILWYSKKTLVEVKRLTILASFVHKHAHAQDQLWTASSRIRVIQFSSPGSLLCWNKLSSNRYCKIKIIPPMSLLQTEISSVHPSLDIFVSQSECNLAHSLGHSTIMCGLPPSWTWLLWSAIIHL